MLTSLMDALFGCWHRNYSFPITARRSARRSAAAAITGTYVVCLDCGREFPYDWQEMRVIDPQPAVKTIPEPVQPYSKAA